MWIIAISRAESGVCFVEHVIWELVSGIKFIRLQLTEQKPIWLIRMDTVCWNLTIRKVVRPAVKKVLTQTAAFGIFGTVSALMPKIMI